MRAHRIAALMLIIGLVTATGAQAVLFRVGPNNVPSPPGNGYPLWYQDTLGVALDLCIPETVDQLDACLATPAPGDPLPILPFAFPTNWPDELFWFGADATFDFDANNSALLVQALEAAFGLGPPGIGDQIVFGRIRIRIDAPVNGTYTVTYPYGEQIFPNVAAGRRAINVTSDVGIGAPGDFTGALQSPVGPFLVPVDAVGNPLPPVSIPGAGGVNNDFFLTDGVTPVQVTGSPFGNNFFRVCVDNPAGLDGQGTQCMETNLFTVVGKLHQGAIGSPMTLDHATYERNDGSAHVDAFATATPGPGVATPVLFFGDAAGTNLMPSTLMNGPTALGQFYGQSIPTSARELPAAIIVTNVADIPPSSVTRSLVDEVTITQAGYDPVTGTLTITATSSDKGDTAAPAIPPPQLFALGLPGSTSPTGSDALTPTGGLDPAEQQLVYTIPPPLPPGGPVPPFRVTVISSAGGQDSEDVLTLAGGVFAPGGPIAVDDSVSFAAGSAAVLAIDVLANDAGAVPNTVEIRSQGNNGTAVADPSTGVINYTFINNQLLGDDTFTYTVRSAVAPAGLVSNVATVTITTTAGGVGPAPIAVNDGPFVVQLSSQLVINAASLASNDNPNGGTLNQASIQIVPGSPTGGTAVVNPANGNVTFTAGTAQGSFGFSYTVANANGQRSAPASVAITVVPVTDVLAITAASFRSGTGRWDVRGRSAVPGAANTITVRLVRTGALIGTAIPDAAGAWALRSLSRNVTAVNGDQVIATSLAGGNATLVVSVR